MSGRRKDQARFSVKFHAVMTVEMKQALRAEAQRANIPEGQVIRQLLADKFGLSSAHVLGFIPRGGVIPFTARSPKAKHPSTKRMFKELPHPLEVAWGRTVITPEEENDTEPDSDASR